MQYLENNNNARIVKKIVETIHENSKLLSEIDGETGDGDHGINMNKGFLMAGERINDTDSFSNALKVLSRTLVMDIGGSMGPIYGTMFSKLSKSLKLENHITSTHFLNGLKNAKDGLMDLAGAKPGDKTLIDTIAPAYSKYKEAYDNGCSFTECLECMKIGAEQGKESTRDMVAKIGRAARLGERSKGHLDAGATSCYLILSSMADEMKKYIKEENE